MLTGQRKSIFPIRLTQRPCLLTANPLFFKSLLISHACGISFRLRSAGFNVPLYHIVLVAVLLRGHPDHFPELLDKMTRRFFAISIFWLRIYALTDMPVSFLNRRER